MKTVEEIKAILSSIETNETMYSLLDQTDIPNVKRMMDEAEPWLAARAIFALSRLGGDESHNIILRAATDERSEVRIAVAASCEILPDAISDTVLNSLIEDSEPGVKKFAIKSITKTSETRLKEKLRAFSREETNEPLRRIAEEKILQIYEEN